MPVVYGFYCCGRTQSQAVECERCHRSWSPAELANVLFARSLSDLRSTPSNKYADNDFRSEWYDIDMEVDYPE
jgi:hypothetical protein